MAAPLRSGSSLWPNSTMIAMVPASSGTPTRANSKKPKPSTPASTAASETSTFTGVPVSASMEPACAAKTMGISSCEALRLSRTAMTTTTGSSAATAPLRLISAVSSATRLMVRSSRRVRLFSPAKRISSWPAQAVTPVTSRPELRTNSEAMKMTAGSPNPPSACPSVRTPVAQRDSAVAIAMTTTGSRFQTKRTTAAAMISPV